MLGNARKASGRTVISPWHAVEVASHRARASSVSTAERCNRAPSSEIAPQNAELPQLRDGVTQFEGFTPPKGE